MTQPPSGPRPAGTDAGPSHFGEARDVEADLHEGERREHTASGPAPAPVSGERADAGGTHLSREMWGEAEQQLRLVVSHAPIILWAIDRAGVFTLSEGRGLEAMGLAPGELVGRSAFEVYARARVVEPDGTVTTAERVLTHALAGQPCTVLAEIRGHRFDTRMVPLLGPVGEVVGVIGVGTDVTSRSTMEERLLEAGRLAALGTLAAGVAHEINNPLTYVIANLDYVGRLLKARADEYQRAEVVSGAAVAEKLADLSSALEVARDGSTRMRGIVRDLTTFARAESDYRGLLDVRSVLEPAIGLVWNEIRHRARLVRDFHDVPLVEANEARLGQVFVNLLINAAQAIPEGQADRHEIGVATSTDDRGRAIVEVRDTGCGIPQEIAHRIFDPFFTTKPVGVGSGLGLSVCHGAVAALGGEISARSAPDRGSVFRVVIPCADLARRRISRRPSGPRPAARRARILIVDDEPLIVDSLRRALRVHEVHGITRSEEALEMIVAGERYDVILCDLMMPVMTGMDLVEELGRVAPAQASRVVFITGGAFTGRAREFLERSPLPRLEKPLDMGRLHSIIEEVAGQAG